MKNRITKIIAHLLICCLLVCVCVNLPLRSTGEVYLQKTHNGAADETQIIETQISNMVIPEFTVETTDSKSVSLFSSGPMSYEYYNDVDGIPYYVIAPIGIDETSDLPLIVWLHGSGGCNVPENQFVSGSLPNFMLSLTNSSPNAYIICPQLSGSNSSGRWNNGISTNQVVNIVSAFIYTHNIDTNKIYLIGHSLGGQGVLYMSSQTDIFAKCISLSPYNPGVDITASNIIAIAGTLEEGEDKSSYDYAKRLSSIIGEENVHFAQCGHGCLPKHILSVDNDNNKNSDFLEWLLSVNRTNE